MTFRGLAVVLCGLMLLFVAGGCTSLRRFPLDADPASAPKRLESSGGLPIRGYSTPDGVFHGFRGKVRLIGADSLEIRGRRTEKAPGAEPSGEPASDSTITLRLSRDQVQTLLYRRADGSKSGMIVLAVLTAGIIGITIIAFLVFGPWD